MTIVDYQNIHQAYTKGDEVLEGVSFSIGQGQVVGLLGKNGAGKTTLLRIAMGMIEPQEGHVLVFGLDPREEPLEVKRRVGYVSEEQILPPHLRVDKVIALFKGLFSDWDDDLARSLIERFSIPGNKKIKALSKGQARQVALLCAVAHRPDLLILDEPAGGLDPAARRDFLETSISLLNEAGTTILFSSHYMTDVERLADRIVMLHDGRILVDTDLDELRESYSLALLQSNGRVSRDRLLELQPCLGVRERADGLHAILNLEPERAEELLTRDLGISEVRCTRIGLEEMFIELAGGQS
jgi:ABC-2 type transport system ATP-binding protein